MIHDLLRVVLEVFGILVAVSRSKVKDEMLDETKLGYSAPDSRGEGGRMDVRKQRRSEEEVLDLSEGTKVDDLIVKDGDGSRMEVSRDSRSREEDFLGGVGQNSSFEVER